MLNDFIISIHVAATWMMVGVIWYVQLVHYPLLAQVENFKPYQAAHLRLIDYIIMPVMGTELITGLILLFSVGTSLVWIASLLIVFLWCLCCGMGRLHYSLLTGFNKEEHGELMLKNIPRVFFWTVRGVLVLIIARGI